MPPIKRTKKSPKSKSKNKSKTPDPRSSNKQPEECFRNYIYRVLREIYDDTGITKQAMNCMNVIVNELFHLLANEASRLMKKGGRSCMSAHDVQNAVRNILPGELEKHAVSEGTKAVAKFKNYMSD